MVKIDYKDSRSIHEQIEDGVKKLIINRILKPDEQLPSVRELSINLTVNPNTVQKAYRQLEAEGFIYSIKGKGNYVSSVSDMRDDARIEELYETLAHTVKSLMYLGETENDISGVINRIKEESE